MLATLVLAGCVGYLVADGWGCVVLACGLQCLVVASDVSCALVAVGFGGVDLVVWWVSWILACRRLVWYSLSGGFLGWVLIS